MNVPGIDTQLEDKPGGALTWAEALALGCSAGERAIEDHLTPLMVLQALACGDRLFVECALSQLTGFDSRTVGALIDRGWVGLRTIYRAAGFDLAYLRPTVAALRTLHEAGGGIDVADRSRHAMRCLSRVLTANENMPPEQAEELLELFCDDERAAFVSSTE